MRIVVTGAQGQVGSEIVNIFSRTSHELIPLGRQQLDCVNLDQVSVCLSQINPDLIINAAAYTAVDKAEEEENLVFKVNVGFVNELALFCQHHKIPFIHLSTDYVFDGDSLHPYTETDKPNPQAVYARSKWAAEQAIQALVNNTIILRVSWVFGATGNNFVKTILKLALSREELRIVADQWGRPTSAKDIARVILNCVEAMNQPSFDFWGIYHYAGQGATNWYEFASVIISMAKKQQNKLKFAKLIPITSEEYPCAVQRPKNSVLDTGKIKNEFGIDSHPWQEDLPELITLCLKQVEINALSH